MSLLNSHLTNLPLYLNIFNTCVIHLINYESIHIQPVQFPIILSRHEVIYPNTFDISIHSDSWFSFLQLDGSIPFPYKSNNYLNQTEFEREIKLRPYKLSFSAQQRNWNCLTRFYILPPNGRSRISPKKISPWWEMNTEINSIT